jgi:hypothetical protein
MTSTQACNQCGNTGPLIEYNYGYFSRHFCDDDTGDCRLAWHYAMSHPVLDENGLLIEMDAKFKIPKKLKNKAKRAARSASKAARKLRRKNKGGSRSSSSSGDDSDSYSSSYSQSDESGQSSVSS